MKYSEEKVKEVLDGFTKTSPVKTTNENLKESNEIEGVKFISEKLLYSVRFTDGSSAVIKRKWVDDYIDGNDSESKRLIESALVSRAKFF